MKKLFKLFGFLKKIDGLNIEDVFYRDGILYCKVKDFVSINPFVVPVVQVLTDEALMNKFKRRDLLKLQQILSTAPDESRVKLIESFVNQNKYSIVYHNQKFVMNGYDLCNDLKLLESMNIKDVCKIVYETAYFKAQQDRNAIARIEEQREKISMDHSNVINLQMKLSQEK